jgi:signal transduction histidine kinase
MKTIVEDKYQSVTKKLIRQIFLVTGLVFLVAISINAFLLARDTRQHFSELVEEISLTNGPILALALWDIEPETLKAQITHLANRPEIGSVELESVTGQKFSAGDSTALGEKLSHELFIRKSGNDAPLGKLTINSNPAYFWQEFMYKALQSAIQYLILMIATFLLVYRVLMRDLRGPMLSIEDYERRQQAKIQTLLEEKDALILKLSNESVFLKTGALTAGLAHELNQFLALIELYSDEALYHIDRPDLKIEKLKTSINNILTANHSAARLIVSLRLLFKGNQENASLCNINDLIREVVMLYRPRISKLNIRIELELHADVKWTIFDALLRQVVANLITNAIDALDSPDQERKFILIASDIDADGQFRFSVTDNGKGINSEQENDLFNLFSSTKPAGKGIGLWLSRYIVERHQGTLNIVRPTNHGGVSFVVTIPPFFTKEEA